jgi:hypothetical protein
MDGNTPDDTGLISAYSPSGPTGTILTSLPATTASLTVSTDVAMTGLMSYAKPGSSISYFVVTSAAGMEIMGVSQHGPTDKDYVVVRAQCGTTAKAHGPNAAVYTPHTLGWFSDFQNRIMPLPSAGGKGFRAGEGGNVEDFGYRTMQRCGLGWAWKAGVVPDGAAFASCDVWFSDPINNAGNTEGPAGFGLGGDISFSVGVNLPVLNK